MKQYIFQCDFCQADFDRGKDEGKRIRYEKKKHLRKHYCSEDCRLKARGHIKTPIITCSQCAKQVKRSNKDVSRAKNNFCSSSCNASYQNAHKTKGFRRSKLEVWLEIKLIELFPALEIHFNRKDAISSELDFYIPSLKLAFELNGIFHYEPIYGNEKLSQIQNNDCRKFQACLEKGIELCIIDSSKLTYFKPANAQKYLDIIVGIIKEKLVVGAGTAPDGVLDTTSVMSASLALASSRQLI